MHTGCPGLRALYDAGCNCVAAGFQQRIVRGRRRSIGVAAAAGAALIAASCGEHPGAEQPSSADGSHIALSSSGDSLGPVDAATPFDIAALAALFPAAKIIATTESTEGENYPVLRIETAGEAAFEVRSADGTTIHSVEILDGEAVASLGISHGATFSSVFAGTPGPACIAGMEEMSGTAACPAPSSPGVTLVFSGDWDGPDGTVPPPGILASWEVERIIWRPGPAASARNGGN